MRMRMGKFSAPMLLSSITPGSDDIIEGAGSGQSSTDLDVPWDYENWRIVFEDQPGNNMVDDGEVCSYADYVAWMNDHGYGDFISD